MDAQKFELMEKWQTYVTLLGFDMHEILDGWETEDDDDFLYLLQMMERINRLTKEPTEAMTAALRTIEMGVTSHDIDDYSYELEARAEASRHQEELNKVLNNPAIVELKEVYNFKFITDSKQYPTHTHYSFTTENGIDVRGRTFAIGWFITRNWLSWKGKDGKKVTMSHDLRGGAAIPKTFPENWLEHGTTNENSKLPWIFAYHVVKKSMPKGFFDAIKFKYPK